MMPPGRETGLVWIFWALFLLRGVFYCALLPVWEGWDEYAHFGYVQYVANGGALPRQDTRLSREIDESMRLVPLAYELRWIGPPYLIESQWWALPAAERGARRRAFESLDIAGQYRPANHDFAFYEAQQPPLYYWLFSIPLRAAHDWRLHSRVLLLRLLTMAVASLAIPLAWFASRGALGLRAAALVAVAPGFAIDTSRIANDGLAILLVAVIVCLLVRRSSWWLLGLALGAALLTKAYLLAIIPVILFRRRDGWRSVALALAIGGWWYARNVAMGQSFSGWLDHKDTFQVVASLVHVNWFSAAHVIAKSFIWFGAWSFITLKSWIYAVIEIISLVAFIGAARRWRPVAIPFEITGAFLLAVAYGVLNYYAAHQIASVPGWYLWAIATPLALITAHGLGSFTSVLVTAFACIDLYGAAGLLAPYYAGLVERNRADVSQFPNALSRLEITPWIAVAWCAATLAIPVCSIFLRSRGGAAPPRSPNTPPSSS